MRQPGEPHQLHFDMDETRLRRGRQHYALRHPVSLQREQGITTARGRGLPGTADNADNADNAVAWISAPCNLRMAGARVMQMWTESSRDVSVLHWAVQVCSSVLYLSDGGGPTVVINQTPGDLLGPEAWLVRPCCGRLTAFSGDLLHGVLPGRLPSQFSLLQCKHNMLCALWVTRLMEDA